MKRINLCLLLLPVLFMACASAPSPGEAAGDAPAITGHEPQKPELELQPEFNSFAVSQEEYDNTLAEVKLFADRLNTIIRDKDYAKWEDTLSDGFFARISSPEFLAKASESPILKSKKIVLKTAKDYFLNVVVPSRAQSSVDEIEFTLINSIKVYHIKVYHLERTGRNTNATDAEPSRLRLYELIKDGDTWKIID